MVAPDIDTDGVPLTLLDDLEPDHCQYWAERAVGVDIAVSCGTTQTAGRPTP